MFETLISDYNTDNWEPGFMAIFVTWQLIVTLDSIRNSCDAFFEPFPYVISRKGHSPCSKPQNLSIDGFPNILDIVNPCFVLQTSRPLSVSFLICASRIRQTSRLGCSQPNTTFYVFVLANASQSAPPIVQLKISGRVSHLVLETITTFPGAKIVRVHISI